jgi:uncharacterized protein (TIGR02588 family)
VAFTAPPPDLRCRPSVARASGSPCPLALVGLASYPVPVRRLAASLPTSFSADLAVVTLRFARGPCDRVPRRTSTSKSRPCWAHKDRGLANRRADIPALEWGAAAAGALILAAVLAFMVRQALVSDDGPGPVTVVVKAVRPLGAGFLVELEARNGGDATYVDVEVEGTLRGTSGREERATGRSITFTAGPRARQASSSRAIRREARSISRRRAFAGRDVKIRSGPGVPLHCTT